MKYKISNVQLFVIFMINQEEGVTRRTLKEAVPQDNWSLSVVLLARDDILGQGLEWVWPQG